MISTIDFCGMNHIDTSGKSKVVKSRVTVRPWTVIYFIKHPHRMNPRHSLKVIGMLRKPFEHMQIVDWAKIQDRAYIEDELLS